MFMSFSAKIFFMASNFHMMLFPPREATTTAEPPEPLTLQHSEFIIFKQILQQIVGPAARLLFIPCVLWTEISYYYRSFSCFSEKIFSNALSFRMMLFPPREATTTAEPPEPFTFQHS